MTAVVPVALLPLHYELIGHFKSPDGVDTWRSSIVIRQTAGIPAPSDAIVQAMVSFWRGNLITTAHYDHSELRNWSRGNVPFSTQGALWLDPTGAGLGEKTGAGRYPGEGTEGVGKEVCAFIRLSTGGPKQGKLFIRALLDNEDIAAQPGGPWVPIVPGPPNVTNTNFQTVVSNTIVAYLGAADPGLRVVHFSIKEWNLSGGSLLTAPFSTPIASLSYTGPTTNRPTRRSSR